MDDLDLQLGQTLFKMAHGFQVVKLFFDGRLGPGLIRGVLVQVNALRNAILPYIPLHAVHGGHSALVVIKTAMHGVGGIIDVSHEHTDRPPTLEPVMMGAIYLDQLSEMGFPLPPLTM